MSFGFAVGDFIAAGKLIKDIADILRTSARREYQELMLELDGLQRALHQIEHLHAPPDRQTSVQSIKIAALICTHVLDEFAGKLKKFERLADRSDKTRLRYWTLKLQWGFTMADEVRNVRAYIAAHVASLNMRLLTEGLSSTYVTGSSIVRTEDRLAQVRQSTEATSIITRGIQCTLEKLASTITNDVVPQLKTLVEMVSNIFQTNDAVIRLLVRMQESPRPVLQYTWVQPPIKFEDGLGRVFPIPSEFDWPKVEAIILAHFKERPGYAKVIAGEYELFDPLDNSAIISASTFDGLRPGSTLIMAFVIGRYSHAFKNNERCPRPGCRNVGFQLLNGMRQCEACGISIGTARSHLPLPYRGNTAENPLANRHHVSKVAPSWKQKFEVVDDHSDPLSHNSARRERLHFKNIRLCHPPLPPTPPVSNVRSSRKRKTHGVSHGATPPKRRILQGDFCMERQPSAHAGMAASTAERRQMILNPLDSLKGFYALHPNIPRTPAPSKSTLMRIEAGKNDPSWADILNIDSARPYSLASVLPSDRRSYLSIATMPDHYVDSIGADLSLDIPMSRDPPKMDYFCTFCADRGYHKTFRSEAGWKFHETTYHETGENWACTLCQSSFDRHVDLTDHLYIHHDEGKTFPKSESFDRSSFDMNTVRLLPRILYGCGFRGCQALLKGWDARCEHVAKHMKDRDDHAQWYYSHILHNLIRQDATRDMAEEVTSAMSTLYPGAFVGKFDLFHAFWDPHTSRTLLQKLQCCDFRPTAARVLVAAFFMQRIEYPETDTVDLPSQLCMPILSTLPGARQTFGSNFEHILKGSSENTSVVIQELLNLPAIMDLL